MFGFLGQGPVEVLVEIMGTEEAGLKRFRGEVGRGGQWMQIWKDLRGAVFRGEESTEAW